MKRFIFSLAAGFAALAWAAAGLFAAVPHKVVIPDVQGYKVVTGDCHIHTVFSDANVWPTTRVEEAYMEGIDAIFMSDHVDTRLQKNLNSGVFGAEKVDRNTSYKLAKKEGDARGVMVVHSGEISRGMPPGHFNVHFVKDNEAICKAAEDAAEKAKKNEHQAAMLAGLREARRQGGFLVWNHPNWERQAPNETKWLPEHTEIFNEGLMDGIEIYNQFCGISLEAYGWALERNLTILSGTDCHKPLFLSIDYMGGKFRPMTLFFVKENSIEGIREAMDQRRTAVLADEKLYGRESEVKPFFEACLQVKGIKYTEKKVTVTFVNTSSIPVILKKAEGSENLVYNRDLILHPGEVYDFSVTGLDSKQPIGMKELDVNVTVENFFVGVNKPLRYSWHLTYPEN